MFHKLKLVKEKKRLTRANSLESPPPALLDMAVVLVPLRVLGYDGYGVFWMQQARGAKSGKDALWCC